MFVIHSWIDLMLLYIYLIHNMLKFVDTSVENHK